MAALSRMAQNLHRKVHITVSYTHLDVYKRQEKDKSQMFVDILPEGPADDGVAKISFYLEPDQDNVEMLAAVQRGLDEIRSWGVDVGAATIEASQTEDKDWINNWKQYFHQFYVDDILIKPSWEELKEERCV